MAPKTILNPPTFRYPFASEISDQPIGVQNAHRAAFQGIQDLQQAVGALNTKMTSSSSSPSGTTIINETSFAETVIAASTVIGTVNNQTGVTAYSTLQSDYGAFLIFNDASPVAVTLSTLSTSPAIALPWFASFINSGTGTVTLTPATGLIEGGATFQIHASNAITVVFDGTNFYVEAPGAQPQNTPAVTHEWLNSFSSITGTFGQSQPAFTDISGTISSSQLPFPTASTLGGVESAGPIANEWIYEITTTGVPLLSQPSASNLSNGTTGTGAVVLATTPTITDPTITGGSINNTPIGSTSPNTGDFTSIVAGIVNTASGTTASTPSGTYVTAYTFPSGSLGTWLVCGSLSQQTGAPSLYATFSVVAVDDLTAYILVQNNGTDMSQQASGLSIQMQQSSGANQMLAWSVTRLK